jgi:hypothetical protein
MIENRFSALSGNNKPSFQSISVSFVIKANKTRHEFFKALVSFVRRITPNPDNFSSVSPNLRSLAKIEK